MSIQAADALMGIFGMKRVNPIYLTIPFPPSVNHYWGQRGNMRYITKRGREFRQSVAEIVAAYGQKVEGRLQVVVRLFQPTRRKCDIDNYMKALLDALQHAGLFDDDEQIDDLRVIRGEVVKGGECRVVVVQL